MKIIGLTGGIASGKSTVSAYLISLGAKIIDADVLARKVVQPGEKAYTEIVKLFGEDILAVDKTLDRKKLAGKVFAHELALKKLNEIIHPEVIFETKKLLSQAEQQGIEIVFIDAPLLIEAEMTDLVDDIWVVAIETKEQLERAMIRDNSRADEIQARIAAQMSLEAKKRFATHVIHNSGTIADTYRQVDKYYKELISE